MNYEYYELKEGVVLIMNFELVKRFERVIIVSRGNVLSMAGGVARMLQNKTIRKISTKQQR